MSQLNPPDTARPAVVAGSAIAVTGSAIAAAGTIHSGSTIVITETVPTAGATAGSTAGSSVGSIQTDTWPARRTRAMRVRQISVLGLFSGVAMMSVRVPAAAIVPVMIVVLAGIDIVGGIVAKSWALGRSPWAFAAGVALFVLLFWVYGMSLRHGELSTITIGWVVLVTLADMGLDRFHYDVHFPLSKWIAALGAVALLAYLLVGTDGSTEPSQSTTHSTTPATAPSTAPVGSTVHPSSP